MGPRPSLVPSLLLLLLAHLSGLASSASSPSYPWSDSSLPPSTRAQLLLDELTLSEKVSLLHGNSSACPSYTGYVPSISRLSTPPLVMNDGPQGFRSDTYLRTTTLFPSTMTVGQSFDDDLLLAFGVALGEEFSQKGANVYLGPGLNVARVPSNGRNFEYLSGGDPYLGRRLVQPLIYGVQSLGVLATAKHWVLNNQETDRDSVSANGVSQRTLREMYYPPFEGAVEAGAASFMCSYNKIAGTYSCENPDTLRGGLKQDLGFDGFVMSDWGATHSTSIAAGLDIEMPGNDFFNEAAVDALLASGALSLDDVNEAARRVLTPMFALGLFEPGAPFRSGSIERDVASDEHRRLAVDLSVASHVLLKNDGELLPLPRPEVSDASSRPPLRLALFGAAAHQPVLGGGGSGAVFPKNPSIPIEAIAKALDIELPVPPFPSSPPCAGPDDFTKSGWTFSQWGCESGPASTLEECMQLCFGYHNCNFFAFDGGNCAMYPSDSYKRPGNPSSTIGSCKNKPSPPQDEWVCNANKTACLSWIDGTGPSQSSPSVTSSIAALAASSTHSLVFVATFAKEAADRDDLSFAKGQNQQCDLAPSNQESLISLVAASAGKNKTAVAMACPGACLTKGWSDGVGAILHGGLPGVGYGEAIAKLLLGHETPSGKMTVTMPNVDNEVEMSTRQYPGVKKNADYSEGMYVDYRWYDEFEVVPAFPFGHGLSYTTWAYSDLIIEEANLSVRLKVANSGSKHAGREVVQLYVAFPEAANSPPLQLKGFQKTKLLEVGENADITFNLTTRDLSIFDEAMGDWTVVPGDYKIFVGSSSRDLRLSGSIVIVG